MNSRSRRTLLVIVVVAMVVTMAFIFGNSLQGSEASWKTSNAVANFLAPVLHGVHDLALKAGVPASLSYEAFVRKFAHFVEYGLLGFECYAVTVLVVGRVASPYVWADLFIVLALAVADEFVQGLAARSSLVSDVVIDFAGACAGMVVAFIVATLLTKARPRKRDARPEARL